MDSQHWQEVKNIFCDALKYEPGERGRFLTDACSGDESLRHEVEELLVSFSNAGAFMEQPVIGEVADAFVAVKQSLKAGQRILNYEIIERLGSGGMGEVYLARDWKLKRKVALKLLPAELTENKESLRRFEVEARTASALNHPNILTIYEIGVSRGVHFIATEFIDGVTLRSRAAQGNLSLQEILDVSAQVVSGLVAAHEAGVIHRDIKPENIMLRRDGIAKLLDFGLAKTVKSPSATRSFPADQDISATIPGVVLGTANYMSPEQARGVGVDSRTDLWSLGVVLYKLLTGKLPFEGETITDVMAAVLYADPAPIGQFAPETPEELQRIVNKALCKAKDERYQTAKELLDDLTNLKQGLDLAAKLETSERTGTDATDISKPKKTAGKSAVSNSPDGNTKAAFGGEYISSKIRARKRGLALTLSALVIAVTVLVYFFYFNRHGASTLTLTDKDTILIADIDNRTGDEIFTGTLEQGLAIALEQSPFLKIFPQSEVRDTLKLMNRSPDEHVSGAVAKEICERQGIKALVGGSISRLGDHFIISLEAVVGRTGDVIAREQAEAEDNGRVMQALGEAANRLRAKLGESIRSVEDFNVPLQQATTSSLEAFQAFSIAREFEVKGEYLKALPFFKRAAEIDPNFAFPHFGLAVVYGNTSQPGLASEHALRAYQLKENTSKFEQFGVESAYYIMVTGELEKAVETLEFSKRLYPRDEIAPLNLSDVYLRTGQWEKVPDEIREIYRIKPGIINSAVNENLELALQNLNRFDEAKEACQKAIEQKYDPAPFVTCLYNIGFVTNDATLMKEQIDTVRGKPEEYLSLNWESQSSAFVGRWGHSREVSGRAIEMASRNEMKAVAAQYSADEALRNAVIDNCAQTRTAAARSLAYERNWLTLSRTALALSICGATPQADPLVDELVKQYPKNTLVNGIWLPASRSALELRHGNADKAIEALESARRYEPAAEFWTYYIRGLAYLKLKMGGEASAEFRKILDHRGYAPLSVLYPLAHLGLARAAALSGDSEKAHKSYEDLLAIWKDADADFPVLIAAVKEYRGIR